MDDLEFMHYLFEDMRIALEENEEAYEKYLDDIFLEELENVGMA